jgi:flavodoxin
LEFVAEQQTGKAALYGRRPSGGESEVLRVRKLKQIRLMQGENPMKVAIVYDSRTGTTAGAAKAMSKALEDQGHECHVQPVTEADPADVSQADLICVGSWTQGLFIIFQHATADSMRFIDRLGDLTGKKAVVFCTYKLATGKLLPRMAQSLESKGAHVVGQFKFRGSDPGSEFASFAASLN